MPTRQLTGTFLCGTEIDIPSNNWGEKEWRREFKVMKETGIDTVILIHSGFRNSATYPSKVLKKHINNIRPCYIDLISLFLSLAEEEGMNFYPGTYIGTMWGYTADNCEEIKEQDLIINKELIEEIWGIYGKKRAFAGWYNSFELNVEWMNCTDLVKEIGLYAKKISNNLPVILSPYYVPYQFYIKKGKIPPEGVNDEETNLKYHAECWEKMLTELEGAVDIVAFQDGVDCELVDFLEINGELIKKHDMLAWSNIETFSRDTAIKFPPIDWPSLRWKLETTRKNRHIDKGITFEFPHFMSPNSFWPSGRCLFERYCEYIKTQELKCF